MRVGFGVLLNGEGDAAIRVAFAQDRVYGTAEHLRVAVTDGALVVVRRLFRVIGNIVALRLQFLDGRNELRNGGADIRQLDDVRLGCLGEFSQFGERVPNPLLIAQVFGEIGDYASG